MKNMRVEAAPDSAAFAQMVNALNKLVACPEFVEFKRAVQIAHDIALPPTRKSVKRGGMHDADVHGSIPQASAKKKQTRSHREI